MIFQNALIKSLKTHRERIAIESPDRKISYAALLATADRISGFLLDSDIASETVIGVSLKNRGDLICAIIGILNARCAFVLLDSTLPDNRLSALIRDLDLRHIITDERDGRFPVAGSNTVIYTYASLLVADADEKIQYPEYHPDDSLYVFFTSGSTGTPKGIVGKNASLLQFIRWEIATFGITSDTRVSQLISPYFDAFLRDVFVPLLAGGTVCIPPSDAGLFSPEKLVSWIDEAVITLIHCVPSVFRQFSSELLTADHFRSLKHVLLSGEKIPPSALARWYNVMGSRVQLVNLYGTTETTMIRSYYPIKPEDVRAARIPVGMPIHDTQLLISNNDFKPCKPLIAGDLFIISNYVTKGYLNNPELTHEKFIRLNAGTPDEKIAFKTGDKARMLADGTIDLIGREDRQIKLRGMRIELDEIERVLAAAAIVRNVAVVKRTFENGDESLVAFVIPVAEDATDLSGNLRQYLALHLPDYMIPADVVAVAQYPQLSNGKIDYQALASLPVQETIIAPANAIEAKILSIWKDVLGDKSISTDDSFHKIGGNSLSIMKLIGRIYKEYNVRISLSELFNNLTIKQQALLVQRSNKDMLYMIPRTSPKAFYHVSSVQERMYYNQELKKESTSYNLPMAWEIKGAFDKARVETVFKALISRHEVLRTAFRIEQGELFQFVEKEVDFEITEVSIADENVDHAIRRSIKPFDLGKAPLLRCAAIHTPAGRKMLVVDLHHIICDGISQWNLLADFSKLYNGEVLKPPVIQYKDYAEWEYHFRSTEEYLSHREFWLRSFEGTVPALDLPVISAGTDDTDHGGSLQFEVSKKTLQPLLDYLHNEGMTAFPGLFSLYHAFLCQLTGQEDIVIGTATSGRMQQELEEVVGMFVKTLPIRYQMDPDISFSGLVKGINHHLIQANSKQVYDLANIVIELNNNRATPIKSLFDAAFVFQNFGERNRAKGAGEFSLHSFENSSAKYPIVLFASEDDDAFVFRFEYLLSYFTRADMELLVSRFKRLCEKVSENLDASLIEIIGGNESTDGLVEDDILFNF